MKQLNSVSRLLWVASLVFVLFAAGCSSSKKKKENPDVKNVDISETIKKDYTIVDASSPTRPGWIVDANDWAAQNNYDTSKFRYYSFETEPKVGREIACQLAKANAKADVAGEVASFIKSSLAASEEGQAAIDPNNPITQPLRNFVESNLVQKVQEVIVGASAAKTHWEKRNYQIAIGAKRDFIGFTCASLIEVKAEYIQSAIDLARTEMMNRTQDTDMKEKVKKALDEAKEEFNTMRGVKPAQTAVEKVEE
jgi:uncharacterized lipoprotein YehR (DUF1307 family)